MKKTKIICSIGPSSNSVDVMQHMVMNGMNVARINCSHATTEEKGIVTNTIEQVRKITGENIDILYDTKGPEFRNGILENNQITLVEGKNIKIVKEMVVGNEERFSVNHPDALDSLEVGSIILLQNGLMKIEVVSIDKDANNNRTGVTCKIIHGGVLGNKKSLCAPGVHLNIPFISSDDKKDIIYACEHDCKYLALSFVNSKNDVLEARKILKEYGRDDIIIMSKIESKTGYINFDEILDASDEIMVGRGDLGDEVTAGELVLLQKDMVKKCKKAGKKVAVATEMMESMISNSRPTRAEVLDVANAVLDGANYVMLSGETTIGKHPIEVVKFMGSICETVENN